MHTLRRKNLLWMLPMILSATLLATIIVPQGLTASGTDPVTVSLDPPSILDLSMTPGKTFSVNVKVADVTNLATYTFVLSYNMSVLNATGFTSVHPNFTYVLPSKIDNSGIAVLNPDGEGFYKLWDNDFRAWKDTTPDGDTTYVKAAGNNLTETSTLSDPAIVEWNIVKKVRLVIVARQTTGDEQVRLIVRAGGKVYNGSLVTPTANYESYSYEWVNSPATGKAWAFSEITNLEAGVISQQNGAAWDGEIRITQLYMEVYNFQGYVYVSRSSYSPTGYRPFNGSATMLKIDFIVKDYGVTPLELSKTDLWNSMGVTIPVDLVRSGFFTNIEFHDLGITSIVASPSLVATAGQPITINVTVANTGIFDEYFYVTTRYDGLAHDWIGNMSNLFLAEGYNRTLTFVWNTTGVPIGEYTITAEVVVLMGDNLPANNKATTKARIGVMRDVAITEVDASETQVGSGASVLITVTVHNLGDFSETFKVAAKYDGTRVGDPQDVPQLPKATGVQVLTFNWDTTGVAQGEYRVSAEAIIEIDDNRTNNVLQGPTVTLIGTVGSLVFVYAAVAIIIVVVAVVVARYVLRARKKSQPTAP